MTGILCYAGISHVTASKWSDDGHMTVCRGLLLLPGSLVLGGSPLQCHVQRVSSGSHFYVVILELMVHTSDVMICFFITA